MTAVLSVAALALIVAAVVLYGAWRTDPMRQVDRSSPFADSQRELLRFLGSDEGLALLVAHGAASRGEAGHDAPSVAAVHATSVDLRVPAGKAGAWAKPALLSELSNVVTARLVARPVGSGMVRVAFTPHGGAR
ncbi:hypothetical protein [Segniliparus rugosus]|uniref:Uncharacterized protein n=1 Tax=Segniliparus rugosus (strain ATCC BAA-974 / DSM 45345 / CCUG 50838 / CIP 108380 / JCM 13579 / CDC 945) TaxID=679197 RepID=U1M1B5_SEGRC|nr:hypothetical protein [Segniliparus rugosus]ERG69177.1 hypothetical protein HMPREF9336_04321 [Segniliparus rugosus ATCC BAA-974]